MSSSQNLFGANRHGREQDRRERAAAKMAKRHARHAAKPVDELPEPIGVEQFPSRFPDAPELAAGIGRTLSRGWQP